MKTKSLKIGDRILCKYPQGKFYAIVENINRPYFDVDITTYHGMPNIAITARCKVHSKDIIKKCKK